MLERNIVFIVWDFLFLEIEVFVFFELLFFGMGKSREDFEF